MCARKLPTFPPTVHSWITFSWLLALLRSSKLTCVLNPATTCLRRMRVRRALGRASPKVTPDLWHSLYASRRKEESTYDLTGVQRLLRHLSSPLTAPQPLSSLPRPGLSARMTTSTCSSSSPWFRYFEDSPTKVVRRQRILCCVDSRVVLGAVTKGRSSSRKLNHVLRKLAYECLASSLTVDLLWVPSWANPADAPSRHFSLERWRRGPPNLACAAPDRRARVPRCCS